jgi:hypothetical protein
MDKIQIRQCAYTWLMLKHHWLLSLKEWTEETEAKLERDYAVAKRNNILVPNTMAILTPLFDKAHAVVTGGYPLLDDEIYVIEDIREVYRLVLEQVEVYTPVNKVGV